MREKKQTKTYFSPIIIVNKVALEQVMAASAKVRVKLGTEGSTEEAWVEKELVGDDGYSSSF